ncbi:PAS domain S-box protein [uncultured Desulfobulbus sp.]|uniref:PAS domain S-box protein n=1 Tax=uncultured Desulfobulbus sp. TaxID=239745 RepID=UPI0029C90F3F|nr:PAS domain S-box protein [uncultured Desulfobulbus sp.]
MKSGCRRAGRAFSLLCFLVVHLLAATGYTVELTSEEKAYLQAKGPVVFVSQTHYPPFEFTETDRQREGMMLDVVRWLGVETGFQPLFEDMSFQKAQEAVLAGRADVLTSLFLSDKRKEQFAFTCPLFDVPASIFIRTDRTDIKDVGNLHGKSIAMQRGDFAKEFLESQGIQFSVSATEDFGEATDRVIDGQADAVIGDEQIVLYHLYSNRLTGLVKKAGAPLYIGKNCMASSQDKAVLIGILNKGIEEARKTGVLDKIGKKWLGTTYGYQESELERYFLPVAVAAALLMAALLAVWLWNMQLRRKVRDITTIILRREESLRESEHNFRVFFDTMDDLMFVGGLDGRIFHANAAVVKKLGFSLEELRGMSFLDLHPPGKRQEAETIIVAMTAGKTDSCPLPLQSKQGKLLPVATRVWKGQWNGKGCLFGISKDLTKEQEALQKFNRLFFSNPAPMALSNFTDNCFVEVNDAFVRTTGYAREEVLGKSSAELRLFFDSGKQDEVVVQLAAQGRVADCELQVRRKDGTILDGVFSGELVESHGQKSFLTVMIDQTDRRRAEQAVRESEEQYRHLFESMLDVYCRIDRDGIITMISPSVARVTGFQPEELVGTSVGTYYDNPEDSYRILSLMVKNGFVEHFELAVRTKCGARRWLSCSARIGKSKDGGGFACIEGIARDITDLRQATLALQQELAFRNAIIDNMADGLCVFHELTAPPFISFTVWNDRMAEITGHTMEAINRSGWYQTLYPDSEVQEKVVERMQAMRQGEELRAEEWLMTRANGEKRTVSISTSFVASEQGTAHRLALVRDITDLKQAEKERRQINQELQQAHKLESLGRMAGATAHHFNNILGAVLGYLELLQDDISGDLQASSFLAHATQAAQRAVKLSHFMLRYAGQGDNGQTVLDFSAEVRRIASLIEASSSLGITLETTLVSGLPIVKIDPDDLHQILVSLTTNAAEALGEAGGGVKIATGAGYFDEDSLRHTMGTFIPSPGHYVFLEVTDNGCGMGRETVTRMFDPFFSTKFVGRGLGLATVSGIIRSCQGGMFVDSESGKGTTVRILMPAAAEHSQ